VHNIHHSGQHLLSLVNDILDLAKIEAGRMDVYPVTFEVADSLEVVEGVIRPMADKKGLALTSHLGPAVGEIYADEGKFKQVRNNLPANAGKSTPEGGRIDTPARRRGSIVEMVVADTGSGVAREDQERIFEAFEQLGGSAARRNAGTGLGLALTRRLVELQ